MPLVEAETAPLVARALEAQRQRTARVLAQVRLAGVAAALVLLGGLSLATRQMLLVAVTGAAGEVLLQRAAGIRGGAWAAAVVVIACAAGATAHLIGRVRALVTGVVVEQRKRERLGRYFSP